jgi:hypothetical protein
MAAWAQRERLKEPADYRLAGVKLTLPDKRKISADDLRNSGDCRGGPVIDVNQPALLRVGNAR